MDIKEELKNIKKFKDPGYFKVKQVTRLEDLDNKNIQLLPHSDLTVQTNTSLIQFEHISKQKKDFRKFVVNPGSFSIQETDSGTILADYELRKYDLLESIDNTGKIKSEADKFFNNLDVYNRTRIPREPKRAVLLASLPGVGKTSSINKVCETFLKERGTTIVVWDTSSIPSRVASRFFLQECKFSNKIKRMILVIEDIGGGNVEDYGGPKSADSSLLNLLDGIGRPFQGVPTFIIATTNNPEQSVGALIDRPGRFDRVIELSTPNIAECKDLFKFMLQKDFLTESEIEAAKIAAKNDFSIAHLQEAVDRSLIDQIVILEAVQQINEHKNKVKRGFSKVQSLGLR